MARILLIIAVVIVGLMLIGPLLGLAFTVLKWALLIGGVALVVAAVSRWYNTNRVKQ